MPLQPRPAEGAMLISCPACPKMYEVPESSIPPGGREVRCTACNTVWFEAPRVAMADQKGPEERGQKLVREGEEALNDAKMPMASVLPAAPLQAQQTQEGRVAEEPRAELPLSREPRPVEAAQTHAQPQIQAQAQNEPQIQVISSPEKEKDKIDKAAFKVSRPFEKEERPAREDGVSLSPWAQLYQRAGFFVGNLFDQLTQIWQRRGDVVPSTPGEAAAAAFRAKARAHQRNRLTPSRLLGWGLW
ncbi:MAG: zinc-ribbon domain-containing protein, partial [Pseudomonadota bacterium]